MLWNYAKQVLDRWSIKAINRRLDKRKLQQEIDTHRLFLLTTFHQKCSSGVAASPQLAEEISEEASKLQYEEMKNAVEINLLQQVQHSSRHLHSLLHANHDPCSAARMLEQQAEERRRSAETASTSQTSRDLAARRTGLGGAVGGSPQAPPNGPKHPEPARVRDSDQSSGQAETVDMRTVARLFQEELGFSLHAAPSLQWGGNSGQGLWLEGRAPIGSVVALYPGNVYSPLTYRQIPGYPRVDRENDYLISRFDGMVLDAKPWTQLQAAALGDGAAESPPSSPTESDSVQPVLPLSELEVRHPLAQGHWANHPSKGSEPNVMVAAFDYQSSLLPGEAGLRAYIPNTVVPKAGQVTESSSKDSNLEERVPGLALVAIRPLQDEEVLLNYRLSTHVEPPPWYHPVDADEDKRRWA